MADCADELRKLVATPSNDTQIANSNTRLPPRGGSRTKFIVAAYADDMLTDDFKAAFHELQTLAANSRTAIMCAEALPWRCHRRLIADQFVAQDWIVLEIVGPNNTKPHELPTFATITAGQVTYPGNPRPLFDD